MDKSEEMITHLRELGTSIHITHMPMIVPIDDEGTPTYTECKCGLRVFNFYVTCPACGRGLKKEKL
jgi:hypothetical protein